MSCSHEMTMRGDIADARVEDPNSTPERKFAVRGSLISDLPPKLVIKATDLRVLDPVGQGYKYSYFNLNFYLSLRKGCQNAHGKCNVYVLCMLRNI